MLEKMGLLKQRYELLCSLMENVRGLKVGESKGAMYGTIVIDLNEFEDFKDDQSFVL